jgi:hypothetical protein
MAKHGDARGQEESADQLLELAGAAGYEVSRTQLARWHRADLLPRPRQAARGRGQGTETLYPPGTGTQLLRLCEIHLAEGEKRLAWVAWRLWWQGYPVRTSKARAFLKGVASQFDLSTLTTRPDELADLIDAAADAPLASTDARRVRKRIGRANFPTVLRILLEVAAGTFTGYEPDWAGAGDTEEQLVEKALGFTGAPPEGSWSSETTLAELSAQLFETPLSRAASDAADDQLASARDELRHLQTVIAAAATIARQTGGPGAGAVIQITDALEQPRPQAAMVLAWFALKRVPQTDSGLQELLAEEAEARSAQQSFLYLQQLREGVPALAQILGPKRLGAAQRSPQRIARLQAQVRETADAHRAEIDAFLDAHPDVRAFIDAPEEQENTPPNE